MTKPTGYRGQTGRPPTTALSKTATLSLAHHQSTSMANGLRHRQRAISAPSKSTQSLLAWKVWGQRLDGYSNADRPTESTPGDVNTLPNGATWYEADIDFIESGVHPTLSYADRLAITRWIDLGAPIHMDTDNLTHARGYFADDLRPVLTVENVCDGAINSVSLGAYDLSSGLDDTSLSVTLDVAVDGQAAGTNFASGVAFPASGIVTVALPASVNLAAQNATLTVSIYDNAGHITTDTQTCSPIQTPTAVGLAGSMIAPVADKMLIIVCSVIVCSLMLIVLRRKQNSDFQQDLRTFSRSSTSLRS